MEKDLSLSLTHTHTHTLEYYSAIKKSEILPFTEPWMDLDSIMLFEVKTKINVPYAITYMWNLKKKKKKKVIIMNLFTKQKQTHRRGKQT